MVSEFFVLFSVVVGYFLGYFGAKGFPEIKFRGKTNTESNLDNRSSLNAMAARQNLVPIPLDPPPPESRRQSVHAYPGMDPDTAEDLRRADLWDRLNEQLEAEGMVGDAAAWLRA